MTVGKSAYLYFVRHMPSWVFPLSPELSYVPLVRSVNQMHHQPQTRAFPAGLCFRLGMNLAASILDTRRKEYYQILMDHLSHSKWLKYRCLMLAKCFRKHNEQSWNLYSSSGASQATAGTELVQRPKVPLSGRA